MCTCMYTIGLHSVLLDDIMLQKKLNVLMCCMLTSEHQSVHYQHVMITCMEH